MLSLSRNVRTWLQGKEGELRTHDMLTIRQKFLADLVGQGEYERAASNCPQILGTDITLWEKWICTFARIKQLKAISHYIPVQNPRLGANVYAMVLNEFLQSDYVRFQQTIREWPPTLYDVRKIITAVIEQHGKDPKGHGILMETLGELYTHDKQFDKALHIYLKLKRGDVFNLISKYNLFDSIQDKIVLLMEFDAEKAAELLVNTTTRIPVTVQLHDRICMIVRALIDACMYTTTFNLVFSSIDACMRDACTYDSIFNVIHASIDV